MKKLKIATLFLSLCAIIATIIYQNQSPISILPIYNTPDFTPQWMAQKAMSNDSIHRIADFNFINQQGKNVTNETLDGKIYVANFMFTICPSICPKMTHNLMRIQKKFMDDPSVFLVSHTVMPWVDSVAQLKKYGETEGINPQKWHLLTGDAGKIYDLARKSYFAEERIGYTKDSTDFLHTEHVLLIDGKRRLRGVYNGTLLLDMAHLEEDILVLKKEKY